MDVVWAVNFWIFLYCKVNAKHIHPYDNDNSIFASMFFFSSQPKNITFHSEDNIPYLILWSSVCWTCSCSLYMRHRIFVARIANFEHFIVAMGICKRFSIVVLQSLNSISCVYKMVKAAENWKNKKKSRWIVSSRCLYIHMYLFPLETVCNVTNSFWECIFRFWCIWNCKRWWW